MTNTIARLEHDRIERDPRKDPVAGDVLEVTGTFRHVQCVFGRWITYSVRVGDQWLNSPMRCTFQEWFEWAATAEVIKRGDE